MSLRSEAIPIKSIWKDDDKKDIYVIPKEPIGRTIIPPLFSTGIGKEPNAPEFEVTATGTVSPSSDWYLPFNGGLDGALRFNTVDTYDGDDTASNASVEYDPSLAIICSDPSGMVLPSRVKIWTTKRHAPKGVRVYCKFKGEQIWQSIHDGTTGREFQNVTEDDTSDDAVQVSTMKFTHIVKDTIASTYDQEQVVALKIDFDEYAPRFYSGDTMNIHKVTFFRDFELFAERPSETTDEKTGDGIYPPDRSNVLQDNTTRTDDRCACPTMEFTSSNAEDVTMAKMTEVMARLMENTSCDDVFSNNFTSDVSGKLNTAASAMTDSEVEAHVNNNTSAKWSGLTNKFSAGGKARLAADVRAEMQSEAQAYMNNDTLKRSRGCDAMTAMATLMTNAQKEASCLMNNINETTSNNSNNTITIKLKAGNITNSNITQTATTVGSMIVKFAGDNTIGSSLNTIMSSMLNSMSEIENGMSAEGLFAPAVSATAAGTISQRTMNEAARSVSNNVITQQLATLRNNTELYIDAADITDSTVLQTADITSEIIAGMIVRNVVETQFKSDLFAKTLADWKSENTTDAEGVSFDWMGLLLAPVLAVVAGGLFLFLGGPAILMRTLTTTRSRVVVIGTVIAAALIGHILCLIYNNIGGAIACGIALAMGIYMAYRYWKASRTSE